MLQRKRPEGSSRAEKTLTKNNSHHSSRGEMPGVEYYILIIESIIDASAMIVSELNTQEDLTPPQKTVLFLD